jgi:hypothetical protein
METMTMQNLLTALCSACAEITNPKKDSKNPHFRNEYASLESVLEAVMAPLQRHGLVLTQTLEPVTDDMVLRTTLWHAKTGERLDSTIVLAPQKRDPQGYAAACTYYRRLSIKAMLGLAEVDDDGNEASQPTQAPRAKAAPTSKAVEAVQAKLGGVVEAPSAPEIIGGMMESKTLAKLDEWAGRCKSLSERERIEIREVYKTRRAELQEVAG